MIPADQLLIENLKTLLRERHIDAQDLALWCGHQKAWISKILQGERGFPVHELGRAADFFGLTVSELFSPGISALCERRRHARRTNKDRRITGDRRQQGVPAIERPAAAARARLSASPLALGLSALAHIAQACALI
jgi:hypothetical protein